MEKYYLADFTTVKNKQNCIEIERNEFKVDVINKTDKDLHYT